MLCIYLKKKDPCYCLAAEEYFLKNRKEDIFMVWQCRNAVVVGKHQNALAEINYRHVRENGISLSRRISGGGTVFHDLGNVNFSFIRNVAGYHEINFKKFTQSIIGALKELGVNAETSGHNDLSVNGKKISGNAEHVNKNRVLHHGTLLFSSDLINLHKAIGAESFKYSGKAVKSNRSDVANICSFLSYSMDVDDFIWHLLRYQIDHNPGSTIFDLSGMEKEQISSLSCQKFETLEWQLGYSPAYTFTNSVKIEGKELNIQLGVENGKIVAAGISGNYYQAEDASNLESRLMEMPHVYESIESVHQKLGIAYTGDLIYGYF